MSDKKNFFESLSPKSALLTGVIGGVLVLCSIGFIVLGIMMLNNKTQQSNKVSTTTAATNTNTVATQTAPTVTVKSDKPKVELFIMSYCPYGLQMQKAYLPVMKLLAKKADMDIKWVNYIMHEKKEIDENNVQYCIQKEQDDKFIAYANCFMVSGNTTACQTTAKIDSNKLKKCITSADTQFNITKNYNDKSKWLSGYYPPYLIHDDLNKKYGVQGSPTLVINGVKVENVSRTPEAIKQTVCSSFKTQPSECKTVLSSAAATAGIGAGTGQDTVGADCDS